MADSHSSDPYVRQLWETVYGAPTGAPTPAPVGTGFFAANPPSGNPITNPGAPGAAQSMRWMGATASGAPTTGTFQQFDWVVDSSTGDIWVCTAGGTPGTWVAKSTGVLLDNGGSVYNVKNPAYGAIGDGAHPTEDTAAFQAVNTKAGTSPFGVAYVPPSGALNYRLNQQIVSSNVWWIGAGYMGSSLRWVANLGDSNLAPSTVTYTTTTLTDTSKNWTVNQWANQPVNIGPGLWATVTSNTATALTFASLGFTPAANTAYIIEVPAWTLSATTTYGATIEGFRISTGAGSPGVGNYYANSTDGVQLSSATLLRNCRLDGFCNLVAPVGLGGHITVQRCWMSAGTYSWYTNHNGGDGGDNYIVDSQLGGNIAGIGIACNSHLVTLTAQRTHLTTTPHGILQELVPSPGVPGSNFMLSCLFLLVDFEGMGNGVMRSRNAAYGSGIYACFGGNVFLNSGVIWQAGGIAYWPAKDRNYAVEVGSCVANGTTTANLFRNSGMTDGDIAAFYIDNLGLEFRIEGSDTSGTSTPTVNMRTGTIGNFVFIPYLPERRRGTGMLASGQSTVTVTLSGHAGPIGSLFPQITPTGAGGLAAAFDLMPGTIDSSPFWSYPNGTTPGAGSAMNKIPMPGVGAASAGGAIDTGSHVWAVTYVNTFGESKLGYISAPTTIAGGNQTVLITSPVWPAYSYYSAITSAKVYRSKSGTTTPLFLVGSIGTTGGTLSDALADSALGAQPPAADTTGGTKFAVNLQPAAPTPGSGVPFNWAIPQ